MGNSALNTWDPVCISQSAIRFYHEAILYLRTMVQGSRRTMEMEGLMNDGNRVPDEIRKEATCNTIAVYSNLAGKFASLYAPGS
jgi:hypothetical protein